VRMLLSKSFDELHSKYKSFDGGYGSCSILGVEKSPFLDVFG
jgi:hypothetical protein